jgi:hypothetical protein
LLLNSFSEIFDLKVRSVKGLVPEVHSVNNFYLNSAFSAQFQIQKCVQYEKSIKKVSSVNNFFKKDSFRYEFAIIKCIQ